MSNMDYKLAADVHSRAKKFTIGDNIMVHIHPESLPKNSFKKLHARAIKPFIPLPSLKNLDLMHIYLIYLVIQILVLFSMWKIY